MFFEQMIFILGTFDQQKGIHHSHTDILAKIEADDLQSALKIVIDSELLFDYSRYELCEFLPSAREILNPSNTNDEKYLEETLSEEEEKKFIDWYHSNSDRIIHDLSEPTGSLFLVESRYVCFGDEKLTRLCEQTCLLKMVRQE